MGGLRRSFAIDSGLGGRVRYLFSRKYVCNVFGSGLLFRTSIPLGTSKDLGRISVGKRGFGKHTLLSGVKVILHSTFGHSAGGRRQGFTISCF